MLAKPDNLNLTGHNTYDVIVVGGGAAGLTAACVAAAEHQSVLLLEQASTIGGTTAISGGMVWIPANDKMAAAGIDDTLIAARDYLRSTVPPAEDDRLEVFLAQGPEAVRYLEEKTSLRLRPVKKYPDYYPDLPGATLGGRVLEPEPFDGRQLGKSFSLLRDPLPEFTLFGGMMISREDIPHLRRAGRSLRSAVHVGRLLLRYGLQRLGNRRGTTLYLGNALAARLLKSALDLGVEIRTNTSVLNLLVEDDRVCGIAVSSPGGNGELRADKAVILATGGISHDRSLRARYVPALAGSLSATVDCTTARSGASLANGVGGRLSAETQNGAFWVPSSTFTRSDGSKGVFPHTVTDRSKPGLIAVDASGRRFTNEAVSYHEFVKAQLGAGSAAVPAFLICDKRFIWKYGLGRVKPFSISVASDVASGYLKKSLTIAGLADALGVPSTSLLETVRAFNTNAREGADPAFGRGGDAYQRHLGDAENLPNPCVAPIESGPFYAIAVYPSDLGMAAGVVTDAKARVLSQDGSVIAGLYACGNDMASVMNGSYPGPGITLGPAITFGFVAARHASSL